jgi:Dolichyl-phosphate-mannose-protein mannosyltransferase
MTVPSRIVLLMLAGCGVAVLLFATASGVGVSPDSVAYIGAARGLSTGLGLGNPSPNGGFSPLILYAPLFPTLLAIIGSFGIDPLDGARCLNSALFAANILLSGLIIEGETGSMSSAIVGSILLLASVPMLKVHSMAWSEPTFVFLSLLALLWLSQYAECGRVRSLIAAAAAVGLAVLSRYAGLALIGAGVGVIITGRRHSYRNTLRDCGVFAAISGLLSSVSFGRNWMVAGTLSDHPAAVHLVGVPQLWGGLHTIAGWLRLDAGPRRLTLAVVAVGTFALMFRALMQRLPPIIRPAQLGLRNGRSSDVARTALTFIIAYGLFVLVAISFFDALIPLDDRILSPILAWALIGGVCGAHRLVTDSQRRLGARLLIIIAGMWFAVAQLLRVVPWVFEVHRNGQGYASAVWQQSEILARVRALPPATRIFSNGDDAIYLLTGRLAERLPERASLATTEVNGRYEADLSRLRTQLIESHGVIVYFSRINWRPQLASATELQSTVSLRMLYAAADGAVYTAQE